MERIRLVILTGDDVRDALKLAAARHRMEPSKYADKLLRAALAAEIAEIKDTPSDDDDEGKRPRGKK